MIDKKKPNTNNSGLINNQPTNTGLVDKKKPKELPMIHKQFSVLSNKKSETQPKELDCKRIGHDDLKDWKVNMRLILKHNYPEVMELFITKLLTQQRTELNREWNSKLLLSQREMINSFKNKVIEELLKDVKKHQDTADSVEMLEFWKQVSYWLKLKQIEI